MPQATTFDEAIALSKTLTKLPSSDNLLKLYAYYKQAKEGDVSGKEPGTFDFKEKAKHKAWTELRGKDQTDAETEYIALVNDLLNAQ